MACHGPSFQVGVQVRNYPPNMLASHRILVLYCCISENLPNRIGMKGKVMSDKKDIFRMSKTVYQYCLDVHRWLLIFSSLFVEIKYQVVACFCKN
jgi:hypothetical protein